MHDHLTGVPENLGYTGLAVSVPREALYGAANAQKTLRAGFTTVRNVGASGFSDVALRDAVDAGELPGPRMRVSGPALGITGGHCDNNLLPLGVPREGRRRRGRAVGGAGQGAGEREVRRRRDQDLRERRRALQGRPARDRRSTRPRR